MAVFLPGNWFTTKEDAKEFDRLHTPRRWYDFCVLMLSCAIPAFGWYYTGEKIWLLPLLIFWPASIILGKIQETQELIWFTALQRERQIDQLRNDLAAGGVMPHEPNPFDELDDR